MGITQTSVQYLIFFNEKTGSTIKVKNIPVCGSFFIENSVDYQNIFNTPILNCKFPDSLNESYDSRSK